MTEQDIQNSIRIALSNMGYVVFRANVGKIRTPEGRYFDTGLPKGFSDLLAIKDGKAYFIEVKKPGGKIRPDQVVFINRMKDMGCVAGIVFSVEEAIKLVNNGN